MKVKRILAVVLSVLMILSSFPVTVAAAGSAVEYLAYNNGIYETRSVSNYTTVGSGTTAWNGGWYVVDSNVTISQGVTVSGQVNLVLMDGCTLTVTSSEDRSPAIRVQDSNSLTIYGQSAGTGTLTAKGVTEAASGIGSGSGGGGIVTIHSGTVNATGYSGGAGIGGGQNGSGASVVIYGGTVNAIGGQHAAGIGSGRNPASTSGSVTVYGGTVTAQGGLNAAGIGGGGGNCGADVHIYGGTVNAAGGEKGAGIGGGMWVESSSVSGDGKTVVIDGGTVIATGGIRGAGIGGGYTGNGGTITINGGNVTANGGSNAAGIGGGFDGKGGDITIYGGVVNANSGYESAAIGGGQGGATGNVRIMGGVVTAASNHGYAVGHGPYLSKDEGSVTVDNTLGVMAGANAASAVSVSAAVFAADHTQAYAKFTHLPPVTYRYYDTSSKTFRTGSSTDFRGIGSDTDVWFDGWYLVNSNVTIGSKVTVNGNVNLILSDDFTLNVTGSLVIEGNGSLTVYGQEKGTGSLKVSGAAEAISGASAKLTVHGGNVGAVVSSKLGNPGIRIDTLTMYSGGLRAEDYAKGGGIICNTLLLEDGDLWAYSYPSGALGSMNGITANNKVTVNGGTLYAKGQFNAIGIAGGTVIINDGDVTAEGGGYGAGISGTLTVNGGTLIANGGKDDATYGDGAGAGISGTVTINGGTVTATGGASTRGMGGAGIGGCYGKAGGSLTVTGGFVTATGGPGAAGVGAGAGNSSHGTVSVVSGLTIKCGSDIVTNTQFQNNHSGQNVIIGNLPPISYRYYDTATGSYKDGSVDLYEFLDSGTTTLTGGWYVVRGSVSVTKNMVVNGNTKLILEDGSSLTIRIPVSKESTSHAGINVGPSSTLTIYGQSAGTGILDVEGCDSAAAIGGDYTQNCGSIIIHGGTVNAQTRESPSYWSGAAIGGSYKGGGGVVTIYGGTVNAVAIKNENSTGAAIGSGAYATSGCTVNIYGGTVNAVARNKYTRSAAIGSGNNAKGTTVVNIYGGTITADSSAEAIGTGGGSDPCTVNVASDLYVTANSNLVTAAEFNANHGATNVMITENIPVWYREYNGQTSEYRDVMLLDYTNVGSGSTVWTDGWYVVNGSVTVPSAAAADGDVRLVVMDGSSLTVNGGIEITAGSTLTVYGQSGQNGILTAVGTGSKAGIYGSGTLMAYGADIRADGGIGCTSIIASDLIVLAGPDADCILLADKAEFAADHSAAYVKIEKHTDASHVYSSDVYLDYGDGTHSRKCRGCNEYGTPEAHTFVDGFCVCSAPESHTHSFTGEYRNNNDGTHSKKCTGCTVYGATEAHIFVDGVCVCGAEEGEWTFSDSLPAVSGGYRLVNDVKLSSAWNVPAGVNIVLDLNGHKIDRALTSAVANGHVISVSGELTVKDSVGSGKITGGYSSGQGGGIVINDGGTVTLDGAVVTGNHAGYGGGVAILSGGKFYLRSGTISYNTSNCGGGIQMWSSTFEMTGGAIEYNTATLRNNNDYDGGGGLEADKSTVNLLGGSIRYNSTVSNGGGVYVFNGTVTADGVTITDNTAGVSGNQIGIRTGGTFILNSGDVDIVSENAVFVDNNAVLKDNAHIHSFTGEYRNNGDGTHSRKCTGCDEYGNAEAHIFENHHCVCGAETPHSFTSGEYVIIDGETHAQKCTDCGEFGAPEAHIFVDGFCVCGAEEGEWTASDSLPTESGEYRLANDVYLSSAWNVPAGVTIVLDLNGHTISRALTAATSTGYVIKVSGELTVKDSSTGTTGKITGGYSSGQGGGIVVNDGGTVILDGGAVTGNRAGYGGGVAILSGGKFYLRSGTIDHNTSNCGAGVQMWSSTFEMTGGAIEYNTATLRNNNDYDGGGGLEADNSTVNLLGGSIRYNSTVNNGGGVYVFNGTVTADGVTITDNTAGNNGNQIGIRTGGTFILNSGDVDITSENAVFVDNNAVLTDNRIHDAKWTASDSLPTTSGAYRLANDVTLSSSWKIPVGVKIILDLNGHKVDRALTFAVVNGYVIQVSGELTLKDSVGTGKITGGNNYYEGGGIVVDSGTVTLDGAAVTGNTAKFGGGIAIQNGGKFYLRSGTISNNTSQCGAGVQMWNSTFEMTGGAIEYNTATYKNTSAYDGGGGLEADSSTVNLLGGSIRYNSTINNGGGVYVYSGTVTADGVTITDNTAKNQGNQIGIRTGGTFILNSGDVDITSAKAVFVDNNAVLKDNRISGTKWTASDSLPTTSGEYWLANDVNLSSAWNVPAGVNIVLDLNGHKIDRALTSAVANGHVIGVSGELTVKDSVGTGMITGGYTTDSGAGVNVAPKGVFILDGGTICNSIASGNAGGVYTDNATFRMYSGSISDTECKTRGAGVFLNNGSVFEMYGGTISGNNASVRSGGGVYVQNSTFTMYDGTISGNRTVNFGGGVYCCGTFNMLGGTIEGNTTSNTAANYGGAAFCLESGTAVLSGGVIRNNTSAYCGGGILVNGGTVTVDGVSLSGDSAVKGREAAVMANASLTLNSGEIDTESENALYLADGCMFEDNRHLTHSFTSGEYIIIDDETHAQKCTDCDEYGNAEAHIFENHHCVCGAETPHSFTSGEYVIIDSETHAEKCTDCGEFGAPEAHIFVDGFCVCGAEEGEWMASDSLPTTSGEYRLANDVNLSSAWNIPADVQIVLDLNGHTINRGLTSAVSNGYVIKVSGELTLKDSIGTGMITGGYNIDNGGGIYIEGTLTMDGGSITNNTSTGNGGGVLIYGNGASFTLNGGTISDNRTKDCGGGVHNWGGRFIMNGGVIERNSVTPPDTYCGGGGYGNYSGASAELNGGVIRDNTSTIYGGGFNIMTGSVTVDGTIVSGNTAENGSQFLVHSGGTLTLLSDTVNETDGHAIYLDSGSLIDKRPVVVTITTDGNCRIEAVIMDSENDGTQIQNGDTVPKGTVLTVSAMADPGYYLVTVPAASVTVNAPVTLSATAAPVTYTLNVKHENGEAPSASVSDLSSVVRGTKVTLTAGQADENYTFIGWYQTNGKLLSANAVYSVTVNANTTVEARYQKNFGVVTFLSNSLIAGTFTGETITESDFPEPKSPYYGFTFAGWDKPVSEINEALTRGENVTVTALYEAVKQQITVTVYNGNSNTPDTVLLEESQWYSAAAEDVDGMNFAYWTLNGSILTYSKKAAVFASANCTLNAVYSLNVTEPVGTADVTSASYDAETKKLTIVAYMTVPEDCKVVSEGLLAAAGNDEYDPSEELMFDNADFVKVSTKSAGTNIPLTYTWTKNSVSVGAVWYARAYVTYTDASGAEKTVYGDRLTITAGQDTDISERGTAQINSMTYDANTKKVTTVAYLTVPDGGVIASAGLVAVSGDNFDPNAQILTAENADYVKISQIAIGTTVPLTYTWTKSKVESGDTWYTRAYLVYTLNGEEHTVYGTLNSCTAK